MIETLSSMFDRTALRLGRKEAILCVKKGKLDSRITYASLKVISDRLAKRVKEMGLKKGETVVLYMPKSIEAVLIHLGIQKVGAISVILNPGFKRDEINYFLKDTTAKIVVTGKKEEAIIRSISVKNLILPVDTESPFSEEKLFPFASSQAVDSERYLHDPALLIYTSGTTGRPKGAILTQQNLIEDGRTIIQISE